MGKRMIRNSQTDAIVVRELNRGLSLNDIRDYTINREPGGNSWLTVTMLFRDAPAEPATGGVVQAKVQPYLVGESGPEIVPPKPTTDPDKEE